MIQQTAEFLNAPVVIADCTTLAAVGYGRASGKHIKDIFLDYFLKCLEITETVSIAQELTKGYTQTSDEYATLFINEIMNGLVVFDEFDKISAMNDGSSNTKYNYQIQDNFLKAIEGDEITVDLKRLLPSCPFNLKLPINTALIPMVFMGAFSDLRKSKESVAKVGPLGFLGQVKESKSTIDKDTLVDWGFKEELLGRIDSIVNLNPLTESDLHNILLTVDHCLFNQYRSMFALHGKEVELTAELKDYSIKTASKSGLGARALKEFFISRMNDILFKLPDLSSRNVQLDRRDDEIIAIDADTKELLA